MHTSWIVTSLDLLLLDMLPCSKGRSPSLSALPMSSFFIQACLASSPYHVRLLDFTLKTLCNLSFPYMSAVVS